MIAAGDAAIPALHAAALEPQRFSRVRLIRTIDSWARVIATEVPRRQLENAVHGVLRTYDPMDLTALAGRVAMEKLVDAAGAPLPR